jgi:hypothetical protein
MIYKMYTLITMSLLRFAPMFKKRCLGLFLIFLSSILITPSGLLWADTVTVPVSLNYPFLNQLLILTVFDRPGKIVELHGTPDGCTRIILSEPKLTGRRNTLRLLTRARAAIGTQSEKDCIYLMEWEGKVEVIAHPVLLHKPSTAVGFAVEDVNLYDQQGKRLTSGFSGFILNSFKSYLRTMLDRFQIDFGPSLNELGALLPLILQRHSANQMTQVINSLHLTRVQAGLEDVTVEMGLTMEMLPPPVSMAEPVLTPEELQQWEKQWESWDAFLSFVIKKTAALTTSKPLRTALLEILLDARYEFRDALRNDAPHKEDPVREFFVRSWQRLVEVLQEIGAKLPGREPLAILVFLTAGDALGF